MGLKTAISFHRLYQVEKSTLVNAVSLFNVDVLKFLQAKQNALSFEMLYLSHGKLWSLG